MIYLKKLTFALIFLILFSFFCYQISSILHSSLNLIFSLSLETFLSLIFFTLVLLLVSFFFVLFATLAQDWKLVIPISLIAAVVAYLFLPTSQGVLLSLGSLMSFLLIFFLLENSLKSYINFSPNTLLSPSIKNLAKLLSLIICLVYFFSIKLEIEQKGFQIPDSLLETALKFSNPTSPEQIPVKGFKTTFLAQNLTKEQIDLLKKNPEALKQSGIDPKNLNSLSPVNQTSQNSNPSLTNPLTTNNLAQPSQDFVKKLVKSQLEQLIEPYRNFIAPLLALLLFLTLYSFISILAIFIPGLLWLVFFILEKSGFISFTKEMREVKKLVV